MKKEFRLSETQILSFFCKEEPKKLEYCYGGMACDSVKLQLFPVVSVDLIKFEAKSELV